MAKQAANRTISTFIDHIIIVPIELRVSLTCMCFKLEEIHKKKFLKIEDAYQTIGQRRFFFK